MIELRSVCAGYGKNIILENVSAAFPSGELTAVIGLNGSGKTTLLKTVLGMVRAEQGTVAVDGENTAEMTSVQIAKRIAYLPQSRNIPDMTVEQMVLHGRFAHLGFPRVYTGKDRKIAQEAMKKMGIEALTCRRLSELSGGMRQNAYVAMVLAQCSDHVLMDEPTVYLDIGSRIRLMKQMKKLAGEGKGIAAVLHDLTLALEYADRILVLEKGKLRKTGTPEQIADSGILEEVFGVRAVKVQAKQDFCRWYLSDKEQ